MANGNETMTAAATPGEFQARVRVLAVDDDAVGLKVLEALLRQCSSRKYDVTTAMDGETALRLLRSGKNKYDLVISDVHMDGMDGFTLLSIIKLEMNIPVILLSADEEEASVAKGMASGACDYLVKPVNMKELKNIWKHVVRRRIPNPRMMQPVEITEIAASRKRISEEDNVDENNNNKHSSTKKNQRVIWTSDLHGRFLQAVNQIGIDEASPKKILEIMKVSYITREAVASHLQKHRMYLNKVCRSINEQGSSRNQMNYRSHFTTRSDDDDELPARYVRNSSYASILGNKLLEASKGIPGDSSKDMTSTLRVPVNNLPVSTIPVNPFPVGSPQMNITLTGIDSHSQDCSRTWQSLVPTELPTNIHEMNQLARVAPPSSHIQVFQDQTTALISNPPSSMVVRGEATLPKDIQDNTISMDMVDVAAGDSSSINHALPGPETDNLLALTPTLPDDFLAEIDDVNMGATWDGLFASENFEQFMDEDWI